MKVALRIIAFPFIAAIILIAVIRNYIYTLWLWLSKGGELITHHDTFNPTTIPDQVKELKEVIAELKAISQTSSKSSQPQPEE